MRRVGVEEMVNYSLKTLLHSNPERVDDRELRLFSTYLTSIFLECRLRGHIVKTGLQEQGLYFIQQGSNVPGPVWGRYARKGQTRRRYSMTNVTTEACPIVLVFCLIRR